VRAATGLVLAGGASRRFGLDKATLLIDGERLVDRTLRVLAAVAAPVLEVGPAFGRSDAVRDDPPGGGPLAAIAAGGVALRDSQPSRSSLVLAVDLPGIDEITLTWLAEHPSAHTVVPVIDGMAQSLCARYSRDALDAAQKLVSRGERAVRALLDATPVHYADETEWNGVADARVFADVDTRDDAAALGIEIPTSR
jgi:molybdopterin-guanine dinucleotide biosynthesis protein A